MARVWAVMVAGLVCCGAAYGQIVHVPSTTNMCPVTHGCRTVTHGMQQKHAAVATGPVQCPPGTYQVPNTTKCRVR